MQDSHPNIDLVASIDTNDVAANANAFHADVAWRFFNPKAPELAGRYDGLDGIADFFRKVRSYGEGSFAIQPKGAWAIGDELVVVQSRNRLGKEDAAIEFDVVVVWRVTDGKIAEVWDIPAVNSASTVPLTPSPLNHEH